MCVDQRSQVLARRKMVIRKVEMKWSIGEGLEKTSSAPPYLRLHPQTSPTFPFLSWPWVFSEDHALPHLITVWLTMHQGLISLTTSQSNRPCRLYLRILVLRYHSPVLLSKSGVIWKEKGRVGGSAPVLTTDSCTLPAPPSSPLANIFPELDRRRAYHLVHIKEGNAAFSIHLAHFEYPVMPFGITNALGISQLENDILCDLLFEVVYLDDI